MSQRAIILCERFEELEDRLAGILDFFDIPHETATAAELWDPRPCAAGERYSVLSTMRAAGKALMEKPSTEGLPPLLARAESAFLFGGDPSEAATSLLRAMTGSASAKLSEIGQKDVLCSVSTTRNDVCGPLAGLQVSVPARQTEYAMTGLGDGGQAEPLLSSAEGCQFAAVRFGGVECFVASCPTLIDLNSPVGGEYFDVAKHFFSAVPLVMYLKHAFREAMYAPVENGACLIIDDPVLRPHYGFVDFQRLAALSAERRFTCSIGFIPWNWRRSQPSVVELFKRHPEQLSLTVHGCDHTGGEFGDGRADAINARVKGARTRMDGHQRLTGLAHESVMVFPQGIFSTVSPLVLKHNGFVAAVNTKVSPVEAPSKTEIREIWRMAILKYGDFAVYTRRYAFHGLHNFAFDLLLGKPCLIASHHDDFQHDGRDLMDFVDRLNHLPVSLTWRPLGEVIRRAYSQRSGSNGAFEARMFGSEIIVENPGQAARRFVVEKQERAPDGIDRVEAAGEAVPFVSGGTSLRFQLEVGPRDRALVRAWFRDPYGDERYEPSMSHRIRLLARRYLCEFRDESQANAPWVYQSAQTARKLAGWVSGRG